MALSSQNRRPSVITSNRRNRADEDFVPAEIWLNVGIMHFDAEKNEEVFVGLERGIPLDQIPNASSAYRKEKNELRDELITVAEELEPGEARLISPSADAPLVIQLRRRDSNASTTTADNVVAKSLRKRLTLV